MAVRAPGELPDESATVVSAFEICTECGRCSCGAAPLMSARPVEILQWRRDHRAMHAGQAPPADAIPDISYIMADPSIGEGELARIIGLPTQRLAAMYEYAKRLQDLVRWLAMPYTTEPEWHFHNQFGQALPAAKELSETYRGVIGHT
jgi:hypothetical protein